MAQLPLTFADICRYFGAKRPKNGQKRLKTAKNDQKRPKTAKIRFLRVKKWSYVIDHFFGTFWQNLKKILGTDFSQSPKNPKMTSISGFLDLLEAVPP